MRSLTPMQVLFGVALMAAVEGVHPAAGQSSGQTQNGRNPAPQSGAVATQNSAATTGTAAYRNAMNQGKSGKGMFLSERDRLFLRRAATSNLAEISMSRQMLQMTNDPAIKRFAQKLIDDHTNAQNQLRQVASRYGVDLPAEPDATQKAAVKHLSGMSGSGADKYFVAHQIQDHIQAINRFQSEDKTGNDIEVRKWAREQVPTLAAHAEMARRIARRIGVPVAYGRPPASKLAPQNGAMKSMLNNRAAMNGAQGHS